MIRTLAVRAKQLPLDLGGPPPPTFDNFFAQANLEAVSRLRALAEEVHDERADDRMLYLWGAEGCGRSHLLQAVCDDAARCGLGARALTPHHALEAFAFDPAIALYAVDDVDRMNPAQQIAVFNLINEVRAHRRSAIVSAGSAPPMAAEMREDLRTRLGWGLVYHLQPLSDADKTTALLHAARARGLHLSPEVPQWLVTHSYRDMPSLMALLDALDHYSLERKRAVTLPLLRDMLADMQADADPETLLDVHPDAQPHGG
jgi:DnaA family protein